MIKLHEGRGRLAFFSITLGYEETLIRKTIVNLELGWAFEP